MLNDPFVIEQAARWAESVITKGASSEQRIRQMFVLALSREPDVDELQDSMDYLTELAHEHSVAVADMPGNASVWQDFAQSLFCLKEFVYVR